MELKTLTGEVIDLTTLKHDSIIIVRGVQVPSSREELVKAIMQVVPVSATVLVFGNQENTGIDLIPETQMNKLGWYRSKWIDRIARIIHRVKKMFPKGAGSRDDSR